MELGALWLSLSAGFAVNIADTGASGLEVRKSAAGKMLKTWEQESNDTEMLAGIYAALSIHP